MLNGSKEAGLLGWCLYSRCDCFYSMCTGTNWTISVSLICTWSLIPSCKWTECQQRRSVTDSVGGCQCERSVSSFCTLSRRADHTIRCAKWRVGFFPLASIMLLLTTLYSRWGMTSLCLHRFNSGASTRRIGTRARKWRSWRLLCALSEHQESTWDKETHVFICQLQLGSLLGSFSL